MEFKLADIFTDADVLKTVSEEVKEIIREDPMLEGEEYRALGERMEQYLGAGMERVNL
jgi:ATP-dependent DNA helicase RecG